MPKFLERELRRQAAKKGFKGKKADQYVYGAMNNLGAMYGSKETAKGREMEEKHEDKMKMKSAAPADHGMRRMEIEVHRGPAKTGKMGKITGHTIHHYMVPMPSKKSESGAFYEDTRHSFPFSASAHDEMMAHVDHHLSGAGMKPAAADAGEGAEEEEES